MQTSMGYAVINLHNPYMGYADFIIPAGLLVIANENLRHISQCPGCGQTLIMAICMYCSLSGSLFALVFMMTD